MIDMVMGWGSVSVSRAHEREEISSDESAPLPRQATTLKMDYQIVRITH
jgi:hypothetical protein